MVRASLLVLVVLLFAGPTLLLAPGGAAEREWAWHKECPAPSPAEDGSGAYEWLEWHAPARVVVDHPIRVAVAAGTDTMTLRSDRALTLRILLDEQVLFQTDDVFEHDGFHTLTFTPAAPGLLTLEANETDQQGNSRTYRHHVQVCDVPPPWDVDAAWEHVRAHTDTSFGVHVLLTNAHPIDMVGLVDVRTPDGRLFYSGWNGRYHVVSTMIDQGRPSTTDVFFLADPASDHPVWTQRHTIEQEGQATGGGPWNPIPFDENCGTGDHILVPDVPSMRPDALVWPSDTDLRFVFLDAVYTPAERSTTYRLSRQYPGPGPLTDPPWTHQTVSDPFGAIGFRVAEPGLYHLEAWPRTCVNFLIVPNDPLVVGTVGATIETTDDDATVTLRAEQDGALLPEYAFDTRLYRLEGNGTHGRLVWMGKLHGATGEASFSVAGLEPGRYEVTTYPSPQTFGTPGVASPDGVFRWWFDIPEPVPETAAPPPTAAEADEVPMPGLVAVMTLLGLVAVVRRRVDS